MERLTYWCPNGQGGGEWRVNIDGREESGLHVDRLAAYEETGVEPEEIAALISPPNDPLTLDELRKMGGEPYWHVGLQKDSFPPHWNILDPIYAMHIEDYGYGKRWLAYRRNPEEGEA